MSKYCWSKDSKPPDPNHNPASVIEDYNAWLAAQSQPHDPRLTRSTSAGTTTSAGWGTGVSTRRNYNEDNRQAAEIMRQDEAARRRQAELNAAENARLAEEQRKAREPEPVRVVRPLFIEYHEGTGNRIETLRQLAGALRYHRPDSGFTRESAEKVMAYVNDPMLINAWLPEDLRQKYYSQAAHAKPVESDGAKR